MNAAVSSATQPGTQFKVDALARHSAIGHELTTPFVSQVAPVVFVVDDDVSVRESLELLIRCAGWEAETFSSAQEFLDRPRTLGPSCLVLDYSLPDLNGLELQKRVALEPRDMPIIFLTGYRDVPMTVQAMKAGALEFLTKPFSDEVLLSAIRDGLDRSRAALPCESDMQQHRDRYASLPCAEEYISLEEDTIEANTFQGIVGSDARLQAVFENVQTVAPADSTTLILGETGTGKELIARAIHDLSPRRNYAFVKVNCAAIPSGLLESELFGHERGAFTGAIAQKIGRFELANKGTLFLDEIGDIPLELQPKLLRVLQEQEFERLGSTRTQRVDVRVVAATNADLAPMVVEKKFRSDLYYRLNVFPILVPPLRDRRDDIPSLVRHFANKYARRLEKHIEKISRSTMEALCRHTWPGNIRELQNLMERAVLQSSGPSLRVPLTDISNVVDPGVAGDGSALEQVERELIVRALRESNWVVGGTRGAAARLRLNRTGLAYKMKKFGISRPTQ
jgi:DNA-binding NtrC family response regulator